MQEYGVVEMVIANKYEKGFTFLEIMISMVILAVGLLALSSMQGSFAEGNVQTRELTTATNLASGKISRLSAMNFQNVTSGGVPQEKVEKKGREYDIDTTVNSLSTDGARQIRVTVSWKSYGRNRTVSLDWVKRNQTAIN